MPPHSHCPVTYESIRLEIARPLTTSEQLQYRGITDSATTGLKYDQLFNITTASELIKAEYYGRRAMPSDFPNTMYLFSAGRGKTAKFNDEYFRQSQERWAKEEAEDTTGGMKRVRERYVPMTMEELHTRYLNMEVPGSEEDRRKEEVQLQEVAKDFVVWCNGMMESGGFDCCSKIQSEDLETM